MTLMVSYTCRALMDFCSTSIIKHTWQAGVPRNNLLQYEEGRHLSTEAVLRKLAEYYGVTYGEL